MGWGAELVARLADWMPVALATWTLTEVTLANAIVTTGTLTKTGWLTGLGRRMERSGGRLTGNGSAVASWSLGAAGILSRRGSTDAASFVGSVCKRKELCDIRITPAQRLPRGPRTEIGRAWARNLAQFYPPGARQMARQMEAPSVEPSVEPWGPPWGPSGCESGLRPAWEAHISGNMSFRPGESTIWTPRSALGVLVSV